MSNEPSESAGLTSAGSVFTITLGNCVRCGLTTGTRLCEGCDGELAPLVHNNARWLYTEEGRRERYIFYADRPVTIKAAHVEGQPVKGRLQDGGSAQVEELAQAPFKPVKGLRLMRIHRWSIPCLPRR